MINYLDIAADFLTEEADTVVTVVEATEIPQGGAIVSLMVVHPLLVKLTMFFLKSAVVPVPSYLIAATINTKVHNFYLNFQIAVLLSLSVVVVVPLLTHNSADPCNGAAACV